MRLTGRGIDKTGSTIIDSGPLVVMAARWVYPRRLI